MKKTYIHQINAVSPLGFDLETQWKALISGTSGIQQQFDLAFSEKPYFASAIDKGNLEISFQNISTTNAPFSRLEKMLILALQPLVEAHPITDKTALILSTTKGNIQFLENNLVQESLLNETAKKVAQYFNFSTRPIVVSNACISGLLAAATAKRLIQQKQYTNAFIIAADELTPFVFSGFQSFQALSDVPCLPFDKERSGVTLGEAAAAIYLSSEKENALVEIIGEGFHNDANHISGPSRTGEGLFRSVQSAMKEGQISVKDIQQISAHGTATLYNDEMEAIAFDRLGFNDIPLNSLKGYFGHTLGASALLELVFLIKSMQENVVLPTLGFQNIGVSKSIQVFSKIQKHTTPIALKTASGFGGCNGAMLIRKIQ